MSDLRVQAPPAGGVPPLDPPLSTVVEPQSAWGIAVDCYSLLSLPTPATPGGVGGGCAVHARNISAKDPKTGVFGFVPDISVAAEYQHLTYADPVYEKNFDLVSGVVGLGRVTYTAFESNDRVFLTAGSRALFGFFLSEGCTPYGQCVNTAGMIAGSDTSFGIGFALDATKEHFLGISGGLTQYALLAVGDENYVSRTVNGRVGIDYAFMPKPAVGDTMVAQAHTPAAELFKIFQHFLGLGGSVVSGLSSSRTQALATDFINDVTQQGSGSPSAELRDVSVVLAIPRLLASSDMLLDFGTAREPEWRWTYFALQAAKVASDIALFVTTAKDTENPALAADQLGGAVGGTLRLIAMLGHDNQWWTPEERFYGMQAISGLCALLGNLPIGDAAQALLWESSLAAQTDIFALPSMEESGVTTTKFANLALGGYYLGANDSGSRGMIEYGKTIKFDSWATAVDLSIAISAAQFSVDSLDARANNRSLPGINIPVAISNRIGLPFSVQFATDWSFTSRQGVGLVTELTGTTADWGFEVYVAPTLRWQAFEQFAVTLGASVTAGYLQKNGYFVQIAPTLGGAL